MLVSGIMGEDIGIGFNLHSNYPPNPIKIATKNYSFKSYEVLQHKEIYWNKPYKIKYISFQMLAILERFF